jgi:hypothetical protein
VLAFRKRQRKRRHRSEWWTPQSIRTRLHAEHDLTLDAAACAESTLAYEWLGPTHPDATRRDALAFPHWADLAAGGVVYLNAPYTPAPFLGSFLRVAATTRDAGTTVVALLPASVGTHWWHEGVIDAGAEVEFLRGRVTYGGPHSTGSPAPWPSALVTYRS